MAFVHQVRDQVRHLLRIRRERVPPPPGNRPGVGARIACGDLRMSVQAGMSEALWRWLIKQGWREVLNETERGLLQEALTQHDGDRLQAAQTLRLPLEEFAEKLNLYGLGDLQPEG